ncbi:MAG: hypothetical protein ACI9L9_001258 [Marivirga sp.]|jgi:hypothetical protein
MKKILFLILLTIGFYGCDDRLDDLNTDKINPAAVDPSSLFTRGLVETFNNMVTPSVNANPFKLYGQYWSQTTYPEESQYNLTSRNIPAGIWTNIYRDVLADLKEARRLISLELVAPTPSTNVARLNNQVAVIDILMAYNYAVLVDVFGNVPFTEALDSDNITPAYDDASSVYDNVLSMMDGALSAIDASESGFVGGQDVLYNGNMSSWSMFANSVKLRLGMRLADANPTKSVSVVNAAIAGGLILSNGDNAALTYQSSAPNTNPVYAALVLSGRSDYVISNVLADKLNSTMDGRLFTYASGAIDFAFPANADGDALDTTFTTDGLYLIIDGVTTHVSGDVTLTADQEGTVSYIQGGVYGTNNSFNSYSKVSALLYDSPEFPGTIFNAAEAHLLMAEAVARGGYAVSGTAEDHYNAGIQASFDQWGASGYADYIAQADVAYATAPGTFKQKIGTQLWVALYNQGFESWNTWKRLDFEGLKPLPGDTDITIPLRLVYPLEEAQLNGQNVSAAATAIGGDEVTTKLFWDMN